MAHTRRRDKWDDEYEYDDDRATESYASRRNAKKLKSKRQDNPDDSDRNR